MTWNYAGPAVSSRADGVRGAGDEVPFRLEGRSEAVEQVVEDQSALQFCERSTHFGF
jgi:hypothetical protein